MAMIVEDGSGKTDANSYCSLAFANTYFSDRNITAWTGTDAAKESWLIRATDYIDSRFNFIGWKKSDSQSLEFPRSDIGCDDVVPVNVQKATAEYALRAISGDLAPDPEIDVSGFAVTQKSTKIGPIDESVSYAVDAYTEFKEFKPYPAADSLLRKFVDETNVKWLSRA